MMAPGAALSLSRTQRVKRAADRNGTGSHRLMEGPLPTTPGLQARRGYSAAAHAATERLLPCSASRAPAGLLARRIEKAATALGRSQSRERAAWAPPMPRTRRSRAGSSQRRLPVLTRRTQRAADTQKPTHRLPPYRTAAREWRTCLGNQKE